jgi:hypothetical protein
MYSVGEEGEQAANHNSHSCIQYFIDLVICYMHFTSVLFTQAIHMTQTASISMAQGEIIMSSLSN